ncbi:hypothetical protein JCM10212_001290 [Sporobolomyces blumeae]
MSAFATESFDAQAYADNRVTYPRELYDYVLDHTTRRGPPRDPDLTRPSSKTVCLDLGCGPGLATFEFAPHFDETVGVEPGQGMVDVANDLRQRSSTSLATKTVRFARGSAERLDDVGIEPETVDLAVACTAAHWFDPVPTWHQLATVLKPGASFAFFTYSTLHFPTRPELEALVVPFDRDVLGPYWTEPGHSRSWSLLATFPFPDAASDGRIDAAFDPSSFERVYFLLSPDQDPPRPSISTTSTTTTSQENVKTTVERSLSPILSRSWTRTQVADLVRTWSACHSWNEAHRAEGRDCVQEWIEALTDAGWRDADERVDVAWEVGLMLGRKKG